jgi:hypothetical protein
MSKSREEEERRSKEKRSRIPVLVKAGIRRRVFGLPGIGEEPGLGMCSFRMTGILLKE